MIAGSGSWVGLRLCSALIDTTGRAAPRVPVWCRRVGTVSGRHLMAVMVKAMANGTGVFVWGGRQFHG